MQPPILDPVPPETDTKPFGVRLPSPRSELAASPAGDAPPGGRLVGRAAALHALDNALAGGVQGTGSLVLVEGGIGTGKTALLRFAAEQARRSGLAVLSSAGSAYESTLALGTVSRLCHAAPGLGAVLPDPAGAGAPLPECAEIHRHVLALAGRRPVLIAVDDLHWVDVASLHCLAFLARRIGGNSITLLIARLTGHPGTDPVLLDDLFRSPDSTARIRLDPLRLYPASRLVERLLGAAPASMRAAVADWTGGLPMLIREVTEDLACRTEAAPVVTGIAPAGIYTWLLSRLPKEFPACLPVVHAVAVLGRHANPTLVSAIAGVPAIDAGQAVRVLAEMGVLHPAETIAFRQPIMRSVVLNAIARDERTALHSAAAERLRDSGASDATVIDYLLDNQAVEHEATSLVLRRAIGGLAGTVPTAERVGLLRRLLGHRLLPVTRETAVRTLGRAELDLDPPAAAAHLRVAHHLAGDPENRARVAVDYAAALHALDEHQPAAAVLRTGLAELSGIRRPDPGLTATLEVQLALIAGDDPLGDGIDPGLGHGLAVPAGTGQVAALLSGRAAGHDGPETVPVGAAWSLLDPVNSPGLALAWLMVARAALAAGDVAAVEPYCEEWCNADDLGPIRRILALSLRAEAFLSRGDVASAAVPAVAVATLLSHLAPPLRRRSPLVAALPPVLETLIERNEVGLATRMLASAGLDGELPPLRHHTALMLHRGRLRRVAGDPSGGLADVLETGRRLGDQPGRAGPVRWRPYAAACLLEAGDLTSARRLAGEELAAARDGRQPRQRLGVALLMAGLTRPGEDGIHLLREAVDLLADTPSRLILARATAHLGRALARAGRLRAARQRLRQASALATELGALALRHTVDGWLQEAGGRIRRRGPGLATLTTSEHQVAQLANEGRTNREIAGALFVTQRTVEMHLTQVYRKLGISGRGDLADVLAAAPRPSG